MQTTPTHLSASQIETELQAFDHEVQQGLRDGTILEKMKGILSRFEVFTLPHGFRADPHRICGFLTESTWIRAEF